MLQNVSEMYSSINLGDNALRFCNGRVAAPAGRPRNGKTARAEDVARLKTAVAKATADTADPYAFTEPEPTAVRLLPAAAGQTYARRPLSNGTNAAAAKLYPALSASLGHAQPAPGLDAAPPERKRKRPCPPDASAGRERSLLEEQLLGIKVEAGSRRETDPRPAGPRPTHAGSSGHRSSRPAQGEASIPQRDRRHDAPWHEALQRICTARDAVRDFHQHLYPLGVEVSESECSDAEDDAGSVFQRHWFSAAHGQGEGLRRDARIELVRREMRHRVKQVCGGVVRPTDGTRDRLTRAVVATARSHPSHVAAYLRAESRARRPPRDKRNRSKATALARQPCDEAECLEAALPCTRHCLRHVVANADQLLFEHCTAKFSDNTQCAAPVFDICHELPLCVEHARKRDNYDRMCAEVKPKKTRKKAKASAMTRRAAKRGRSKRKRRSPQKLAAPACAKTEPIGRQLSTALQQIKAEPGLPQPSAMQHVKAEVKLEPIKLEQLEQVEIQPVGDYGHQQFCVDEMDMDEMDSNLDMYIKEEVVESLDHPDMHAMLKHQHTAEGGVAEALSLAGLPLDPIELANQAARLLEEHDLNNVLNQIPADAFNDLFTEDKNGAYEPTREETEELERALEAVDKDVKSLEKLSQTQGLLDTLMDDPALALGALAPLPAHSAAASFAAYHHNGFVSGGGHRKCTDTNAVVAATAGNISIQTQTNMPS